MKKTLNLFLISLFVPAFIALGNISATAEPCAVHIVNNTGSYFTGEVEYILNSSKTSTSDKLQIIDSNSTMIYAMCGSIVKVIKDGKTVKEVKAASNIKIYIK